MISRTYVKILKKILHMWDVFFTFVDHAQLKGYVRFKRYIQDKEFGN